MAERFAAALLRLPHLVLVPIDAVLAMNAVGIAARNSLRGSDAVYVAAALRFACPLVTLDREQNDRASLTVTTLYPVQALASMTRM